MLLDAKRRWEAQNMIIESEFVGFKTTYRRVRRMRNVFTNALNVQSIREARHVHAAPEV